ncbi:histidine kinase [Paraburkholderia tropica]|uniref:histidine kinase n=2 Tax=Burkholderiaceae TaxID=119060 RepID=A0A1A5XIA3_9BURK|nr:histidine kinase [Paraburkholderia tropica]PXX10832.1 signal transduction histidine kinase [Paraburkholderia tropica]PZW75800.1 signal transduction histidine kinase [Paraburkholderia tropica]SEK12668.1 Signal transduction histidine kinase [Paraburkholderia tropica]
MRAYPAASCDTPARACESAPRRPVAGSAGMMPRVLSALLAALLAAACGYAAFAMYATPSSVAHEPYRFVAPLVLPALAALAFITFQYGALRAQLRRHAQAFEAEAEAGEGVGLALPESGPAPMARLARAANRCARQRAGRQAELLHVLAAYAHDLRTPLTRMGMRCELLDDDATRDALQRDLAEMAELVEGSLSCARMQCSADEPMRSVDADSLLDLLIADYRDAGRIVTLDGRVGRPLVTCPHALRRVLVNLIDNALRYGDDVCLSVRVETRRLVIAVLDTGPGIVPAQLEAVFLPWYRAPGTAAATPGSGLGLAIARRLTHAMRGELHLENRCTGGLEARLTLPLNAP